MGVSLQEKGIPLVNGATCTGCGKCIPACPDRVFSLIGGKAVPGPGDFMGCIACGHCVATCPTNSISVTGRGMQRDDAVEFKTTPFPAPEQFEAMLLKRRSIRRFEPRKIDRSIIDRILDMTATAPMGIPPSDVNVLVFHGQDRVQELSKDACEAFEKAALFFNPVVLGLMRPFLGKENYEAMRDFVRPLLKMLAESRRRGEDLFSYNAAAALLFHHGPMSDTADCHIAATYAMLAAESFGLGSCMLGTTIGLNNAKPFKQKYGVPAKNKFGVALILGYPAERFQRGVKRRLESVRYV